MLSIMIVSHGILSYVKQCYKSLVENLAGKEYEVLLFTCQKDEKIAKWADNQGISCVVGDEMTLGAVYAMLADRASGDTFLFLHDDIVILPNVVESLVQAAAMGAAAAGPCTNRCQYQEQKIMAPDYKDYQTMLSIGDKVRQSQKSHEVLFLESFCLLIRRDAYEAVGGFRDDFFAVGGEDIDISFRLRERGYHLQLVPVYVHHERGTIASQHGEKNRPAWQKKVAQLVEKHWGLHTGVPEELWREPLMAFNWQRGGRGLIKSSIRSCMLSAPMVSIMIPTYNRPILFEKTLKSALSQTYPNIEIIVCDNSTNEDTKNLMQKYITDERVRYIWNPEAKCKEENFAPFERLAQGEFLQWCMDDDILLPDKLKKMIGVFIKYPEVTLVTSCRGVIDVADRLWGKLPGPDIHGEYGIFEGREIAKVLLQTTANFVGEPSAVLFRRRDLKDHYWRASCRDYLPIADVAMWLQLLEKGDFAIFAEPLSYYRRHPEQEGQRTDIALLARQEWVRLADEYYSKRVFLTTERDIKQALRRNIEIVKNFSYDILSEVSAEEKRNFMDWLGTVEKRAE